MLVDLLTSSPVFVLILWFVWITIRDRRRGESTSRTPRPRPMDLTALYLIGLPAALYVRAVRILRGAATGAPAGSRCPGTPGSR